MNNKNSANNRQECIVYSRVVGWMTPVKNWNKGKRSEFKDRKTFIVEEKWPTSPNFQVITNNANG